MMDGGIGSVSVGVSGLALAVVGALIVLGVLAAIGRLSRRPPQNGRDDG